MSWRIIHGRDRALFVLGAERGHATYTRDTTRALRFDSQREARVWIDRHIVAQFGAVVLMRVRSPRNESPAQAGEPGGASLSKHERNEAEPHAQDTAIPAAPHD